MNKKGNRNTNGEGCIYNTIAKQKRKNFLSEECKICKNCTDRTACNNRTGYDKCIKCEECKTECLTYCDRFYCYERNQAQITIDGKQTTVATAKKKKDVVYKKMNVEAKILTKEYVKANGITLPQKITKIYDNKLDSGIIKENTYRRNFNDLKHIQNADIGSMPMQKITSTHIQNFINSKTYLSQRTIDSILQLIKTAFNQAVIDKEIAFSDNPILKIIIPNSKQIKEPVNAFEVFEEIELIKYLNNNVNDLVTSSKTKYNSITIKNLILLGLFTGMRIGEIGALDFNKHIDFEKNEFIVERTLTKTKDDKVLMGSTSKTGLLKKRQHKIDIRYIPFEIFDKNIIINILNEQINISKSIPNNKENLLFCRSDGSYIDHKQITTIFKKICRKARIKLDLEDGCHFHMTRHTFATRCIESGMDLLMLSKLLGHNDTKQIERTYGHILNRYRDENLYKLKDYYIKNDLLLNQINTNIDTKKTS